MATTTASNNRTLHIDSDGVVTYPCWCGKSHGGDYGFNDWAMHNCPHEAELTDIGRPEISGYFMCPDCGKTFHLVSDD